MSEEDMIHSAIKEAFNEVEGHIEFDVERGYLFDDLSSTEYIMNVTSEDNAAEARVYRNPDNEFVLEHVHERGKFRQCSVPMDGLRHRNRYHLVIDWSPSELRFEVGPAGETSSTLVRRSVDR